MFIRRFFHLLVLSFSFNLSAWGEVTVYQVNLGGQDNNTHYAAGLATSSDTLSSGFIDSIHTLFRFDKGYADETDGSRTNMIVFDVYSDKVFTPGLSSNRVVLLVSLNGNQLTTDGANRPVFLPIAAVGDVGCLNTTACYFQDIDPDDDVVGSTDNTEFTAFRFGVSYSNGSTVRVGLYPKDICAVLGSLDNATLLDESISSICDSDDTVSAPNEKSSATTFNLNFVIRIAESSTDLTPAASPTEDTSETQGVKFYGAAPSSPTCTEADMYFPGDEEIIVKTGNISATQAGAGAPFSEVVVIARNSSNGSLNTSSSFRSNNDVVSTLTYNTGEQPVTGFTNTTNIVDNSYYASFAMKDKAGLVSEFTGTNCQLSGVFTAEISGFLKNSDCFVATASYQNKNVFPVQILRHLRNGVLLRFGLGRWLIEKYYQYGPQAAIWLKEHPAWRGPVLLLLTPFEVWSWLGLTLSGHADENPSVQPYIDRVKNEMESTPNEGSFIEKTKREIEKRDEPERGSLIEKVKRENSDAPQADFISEEKARILKEEQEQDDPRPESAIEAVKSGKSELKLVRKGKIRGAFGLRVGATFSDNITASGDASSGRSFTDVYGTSYRPDFSFFYEYQLFHSEWVGSLGLMGMVGASFIAGKGTFALDLPIPGSSSTFGTASKTNFTFLTIPLVAALNYRLNTLRIVRPFVAFGPALIPFFELRSDSKAGQRGYSKAIYGSVGVSLLLDWISRESSWKLYSSSGVKHYYLTLEYSLFKSFASNVNIDRSGLVGGLAFEI